ncbi:DUF6515 family protein [Haloferula sargassicola]|uniref:Lipoprotein n=1 Tax=Haloferula sargassicola TaxID=490096 RepID=A0ABP9URV0_9BACT
MKLKHAILTLAATGAALAFSSCVDPYYGAAGATTYQPGYVINTLPSGYNTVDIGGTTYYRHNNTYYRPRGNRYVVVEAPNRGGRGHDHHYGPDGDRDHDGIDNWHDRRDNRHRGNNYVQTLPRGYRVINRGGTRYYVANDTYYVPRDNGYVIVANPF